MKQKFVGTYQLGNENVDLWAILDSMDGCFYFTPDDNSKPRIKVGIGGIWETAVEVLLHESLEFLLARHLHRYEQSGVIGDHASYLFSFNHCALTHICQRQAQFLIRAMPDLVKIHEKHKKKVKK